MRISELYLHPVKSGAALSVQELTYTALGPTHDRQWMIVDDKGLFLSQRKYPKLCQLKTNIETRGLTLSAEGHGSILLGPPNGPQENDIDVTVWQDNVIASDCGETAATWLSEFLGTTCRLVCLSDQTARKVDVDFAKSGELVAFADGFPTLVVTQESLDEFNSHLDSPIDMRRFRPNIVIAGATPYAEDQWQTIRIGEIELDLVKPCSRCIMPSINPDTAKKEMAINEALLKTRRRDRTTYFGQNALHRGLGKIHVGDAVELLA